MRCHNNDSCHTLSAKVLPENQKIINSDFNKINTSLETIKSTLKDLNIPNDYIGSKINEEIDSLSESLNENIQENNDANNKANNYIESEIKIHNDHYQNWLYEQQNKEEEDI